MKKYKLKYLPIDSINPFDKTHWSIEGPPGFEAKEKSPKEHLIGAYHFAELVEDGSFIFPIAVTAMKNAPKELRVEGKDWQRCDGFKRFWGQKLAGVTEVLCAVYDEYLPGIQKGCAPIIEENALGKILIQLSEDKYEPGALPYSGRISIEDCETVHVHVGHLRLEFTRQQFLQWADKHTEAAAVLRKRRGL